MALDSTWGNTHFHRNEIFNTVLKEAFRDDLFASQWVNYIGDFTDGSNYKIGSVGELTVDQAAEATALPDRRPDSGQFVFNIDEYVGVKTAFTDVFLEDDFMAPQVLATLPDRMMRAFEEYLETSVLKLQSKQTTNGPNAINGAHHRFIAGAGANRDLTTHNLAYVAYALKKAAVGNQALVGLVDPSFEFNANVFAQVTTTDNPRFDGMIETGFGNEFRFVKNIYGIDLYTTNYLDTITAQTSGMFKDDTTTADNAEVGDVVNVFFSARDRMDLPFIGAWRRQPVIKSWREEAKETEYHQMTARFGLDLYRPENLVCVVSDPTQLNAAA